MNFANVTTPTRAERAASVRDASVADLTYECRHDDRAHYLLQVRTKTGRTVHERTACWECCKLFARVWRLDGLPSVVC